MDMAAPRYDAHLTLMAKGLPSKAISDALGLLPDEAWDEGEAFVHAHSGAEGRRRFTQWSLVESAASDEALEPALLRLVERARPVIERAGFLPAGVEINLQLMITSTQSVMGVYLHPRVVRALSELGGGIDMSIVAVSERPPG